MAGDRYYIGGGVIASLVGVGLFSPRAAYHKIIGDAPEPDEDLQRFFRRRAQIEPYVRWILENERGYKLPHINVRYTDPSREYFKAEIDCETECKKNVEIKSVADYYHVRKKWGRDGDPDAVPDHVVAQALWGMPFTGAREAFAVGQIGFDDTRLYPIYYDEELIDGMRKIADDFWHKHVIPRVPPEATTAQDVVDFVRATEGKPLFADQELANLVAEAKELSRQRGQLEKQVEERKNQIKVVLQDCSCIIWNGKTVLTWDSSERRGLNQSRLQAEMPEAFERYYEKSTTRTMRFK